MSRPGADGERLCEGIDGVRTVVVDLEATCWDARDASLAARQRAETEVIEIGAVLLDGTSPPRTFQVFVRPRRWPVLSAFCTEFTGITQADVEAADLFPGAWARFLDFCGGDEGLVFASWGAWDDQMLRRECRRWSVRAPRWTPRNVKAMFAERRGERMGLHAAIGALGQEFEGRCHRGLDDARNVVRVLNSLRTPTEAPP